MRIDVSARRFCGLLLRYTVIVQRDIAYEHVFPPICECFEAFINEACRFEKLLKKSCDTIKSYFFCKQQMLRLTTEAIFPIVFLIISLSYGCDLFCENNVVLGRRLQ